MMNGRVGLSMLVIGVLHTMFGVVRFAEPLGGIVADGVLNVSSAASRGEAIWFLFCGFLMLLLGYEVSRTERRGDVVGGAFGIGLIALSVLGVVLKPASGFWLLLLLGAAVAFTKSRGAAGAA